MNTSDKIKLTAEIASRLISAKPEISIKDCVELAKEIIEESEKIYIHEYQSTPLRGDYSKIKDWA